MDGSGLVEQVQANTSRFRRQMTDAGFTVSGDDHPICPVMLGDARLAATFADLMLGEGCPILKETLYYP